MFSNIRQTEDESKGRIIRAGIIGCGMVTQVFHIPTLNFLSHMFHITNLWDVSHDGLNNYQLRTVGATKLKVMRTA
ncbi:uncharacterized protein PV09_05777 [Verruconis gallopava]|uniref:Gfo/Idh/MocA-like oxidoreductase N-terminal domain-containing protein n=1 Tax=Verruconis gallopava TaxID=253628 RepID=A0A0D2A989_9PEZI|nr:uncharacterized protein PV09_05777 [Verruconis gallopava]KIW03135.1 hypothetical protein PV09_05777 [Verruconis gallopava]